MEISRSPSRQRTSTRMSSSSLSNSTLTLVGPLSSISTLNPDAGVAACSSTSPGRWRTTTVPPALLTVRTLHSDAGSVEEGADKDVVGEVVLPVVGKVVFGGSEVEVDDEVEEGVDEDTGRVGAEATGTSPT